MTLKVREMAKKYRAPTTEAEVLLGRQTQLADFIIRGAPLRKTAKSPRTAKPYEFRSSYDVKRLKEVGKDLRRFVWQKRAGIKTQQSEDLISLLRRSYQELEWEKQHPLLASGLDSTGITQFERALQKGTQYGFSLQDPVGDFIRKYRFKRHELKGLKISLLPASESLANLPQEEKLKQIGLKTRAYVKGSHLHLPPVSEAQPKGIERTMIHEVAHHIYNRSKELYKRWDADTVKVKQLLRDKKHRLTGKVEAKEATPATIVTDQRAHFGFSSEVGDLFEHELSRIIGGTSDEQMVKEAFAEAFVSYRTGQLKKLVKQDAENLKIAKESYEEHKERLEKFEGDKDSSEYQDLQKYTKQAKDFIAVSEAIYHNRLVLLTWMKQAESKGWWLPKE